MLSRSLPVALALRFLCLALGVSLGAISACLPLANAPAASSDGSSPGSGDPQQILADLTQRYTPEAPDSLSLVVEFRIQPMGGTWHVVVEPGPQVSVHEGSHDQAAFIFTMTSETLHSIYTGQMTATTALAKASAADNPPLDFHATAAALALSDLRGTMLEFLQRFFNPTIPERTLLGEEHSRVVHGANVIPLYYATGLRSAWYMIKKGQRLNAPGDTNNYPQAFVFISGKGTAKIGDDTVDVHAGESYYIPPGSDHVVWTEDDEPVVLIWLAWGEGA